MAQSIRAWVVGSSLLLVMALGGCYQSQGPLVSVGDTGYGPKPRANIANIPPGPEHQVCRDEMGRALDRIAKLEKDLDKCKRERDAAKDEAKTYRKQVERLGGH
ncbi:MAG: hypothetical protein PHU85_04390 [Phycisphaerae bacterium]|nr:hypothetical protein [Phycisphaerae bacterium]